MRLARSPGRGPVDGVPEAAVMLLVDGVRGGKCAVTGGDEGHHEPVVVGVAGPQGGAVDGGVTGAGKPRPFGDYLVPECGLIRVEGGAIREQERVLGVVERADR